jgi:hypothetical protein
MPVTITFVTRWWRWWGRTKFAVLPSLPFPAVLLKVMLVYSMHCTRIIATRELAQTMAPKEHNHAALGVRTYALFGDKKLFDAHPFGALPPIPAIRCLLRVKDAQSRYRRDRHSCCPTRVNMLDTVMVPSCLLIVDVVEEIKWRA